MKRSTRDEILEDLASQRSLLERYGISAISLFGSVARGEATESSDVDLLVEFSRPIGLLQFVELKRALEEALGRRVDLVTPKALKPQFRDRILKEAIRAATRTLSHRPHLGRIKAGSDSCDH
jgi:predicted nucleotidyltransferase